MSQIFSWWRHQMETFSSLLVLCAGNSPVTGEFPAQRPVTRNFDVPFDLRLNKWLSKQWWGWWFETPSRSLWRYCNVQARFLRNWWPVCDSSIAAPSVHPEAVTSASHPEPFYWHGLTEIMALIEPQLNARLIWVNKSHSFMGIYLFSMPFLCECTYFPCPILNGMFDNKKGIWVKHFRPQKLCYPSFHQFISDDVFCVQFRIQFMQFKIQIHRPALCPCAIGIITIR